MICMLKVTHYSEYISQKLPVDGRFKSAENTSQFSTDFIENYNEDTDEVYFLEVNVQYPEKLHKLHNDVLFLPERMNIEKNEKLAANLHDKKEYVLHIKILKRALSHR